MQRPADSVPGCDESPDERRARDLLKLIRKLRWIGEEEEAEHLTTELLAHSTRTCVLTEATDTD